MPSVAGVPVHVPAQPPQPRLPSQPHPLRGVPVLVQAMFKYTKPSRPATFPTSDE